MIAMMISQSQLLSKRLQKQLFISLSSISNSKGDTLRGIPHPPPLLSYYEEKTKRFMSFVVFWGKLYCGFFLQYLDNTNMI